MKTKYACLIILAITSGVAAGTFGWGYVSGTHNARDFNDVDVNERLTEAGRNCRNSPGSCPVDDTFAIVNDYTNEIGIFVWTGSGFRDVFGNIMPIPCGPLDCGDDDPIGDTQGY